tara:strand:- start:51 stop:260 length:210 start_codon:yes stop_codon:yes gene_type:complete
MEKKRSNFYSNGEFIPYQMPQDFRKSTGRGSCGSCGLFSRPRNFCGLYKTQGVKDIYVCNKWRPRHFKR